MDKPKFDLGDVVVLKHDQEKLRRFVTGITLRPAGTVYLITQGRENESAHYDFEIELAPVEEQRKAGFR